MGIQIISLKCPECNAQIHIEPNTSKCFCTYCGASIIIHNDNEYTYRKISETSFRIGFAAVNPADAIKKVEFAKKMLKNNYPEIWKQEKKKGIKQRFHGGMDGIVINAFIQAVLLEEDTPINVYDTAVFMAITPLSEQSIKEGRIVEFPDFTKNRPTSEKKSLTNPYALD